MLNTRARRNTRSRDVRPKVWVSICLRQKEFAAIMGTMGLQHKVLKKESQMLAKGQVEKGTDFTVKISPKDRWHLQSSLH